MTSNRYLFFLLNVLILSFLAVVNTGWVFASDSNPEVKILLFSDVDTNSVRFMHFEHTIRVSADGKHFNLSEQNSQFLLEIRDSKLSMVRNGNRRQVSRVTLSTDEEYGLIRLIHPAKGWLYYTGTLEITAKRNQIRVINTTDLENYIAGVVGGEMDFTHPEALKVQSVISRTYAMMNIRDNRTREYHLTDTIMNQVYPGELILKPWYREAANATRGEVLTWNGSIILAAYHSTCGGITTGNESVWIGEPRPYLRPRSDLQSCSPSPHSRWDFSFTPSEIGNALKSGVVPDSILISAFDDTGRATEITLYQNGRQTAMNANIFRLALNREFGTRSLKSTFFTIQNYDGVINFRGKGMGHGVGLCQWGALGFAELGWDYVDILKYYYSRVELKTIDEIENADFRLARF